MKMMMMMETQEEQSHFKRPKMPPPLDHHLHHLHLPPTFKKTQLCRRFQHGGGGVCAFGSKCKFAHGIAELNHRTTFHQPKPQIQMQQQQQQLCRMFFRYRQCSYGHTCRFLHSSTAKSFDFPNWVCEVSRHPQPQPQQGKLGQYSSAEYRVMQTSDAAATNASTNTVATSTLHKTEEPYAVKFMFKKNGMRKINGIYGDWI